jgi:hypothetical protein
VKIHREVHARLAANKELPLPLKEEALQQQQAFAEEYWKTKRKNNNRRKEIGLPSFR